MSILRFAQHCLVVIALSLPFGVQALTCLDLDGAYIFSQENPPTYLGFFGSPFAGDSVENQYGQFGSQYQSFSIRNPFGNYGSQYAQYSVANPFTQTPPVVYRSGEPLFYLTANATLGGLGVADIDEECGTTNFVSTEPATNSMPPLSINLDQHGLSGTWSEDGVSGQGVALEIAPDLFGQGVASFFAGWFTYGLDSTLGQRWYTIQGQVTSTDIFASLPVYVTTGGVFASNSEPTTVQVGNATIKFFDCAHALVSYDLQDETPRAGFMALTRVTTNESCSIGGDVDAPVGPTGIWASAGASAQGLTLDFDATQHFVFGGWFTYASGAGSNAGLSGQRWLTLQGAYHSGQTSLSSLGIYETTGGSFSAPGGTNTNQVGTAQLVLHDCQTATLTYEFATGATGTEELARVTPAPQNCSL